MKALFGLLVATFMLANTTSAQVPSVTVAANVAFPVPIETPVTWTAHVDGDGAGLLYQFWLLDERTGFRVVQDYSASHTYTWTPGLHDTGTYDLQVWVKTPASVQPYDAWTAFGAFRIYRSTPFIWGFDTTHVPFFYLPPNTPVTITAQPVTGSGTLEYQFWLWHEVNGWSLLRPYNPSPTFTWVPTQPGVQVIDVWARGVGVATTYETHRQTDFYRVRNDLAADLTAFSPDRRGPFRPGEPITFSASAALGFNGPLQYRFWRQDADLWTMVQDYSTSRSYTWTPTYADRGKHALQVWVRSTGSTAAYEDWLETEIEVVVEPFSEVTLTADVVFPVPSETPVDWRVSARGGVWPLQYKFWLWKDGTWTMVRDYSPVPTFRHTPTAPGAYLVEAWVRNAGSTAAFDTSTISPLFSITSGGPAAIASLTADAPFPVVAGTVTWTAKGTAGTAGPLVYEFWRVDHGTGMWSNVQPYSTNNAFTWTMTNADQGDYTIQAFVKSADAAAPFEGWAATEPFTILAATGPASITSLTPDTTLPVTRGTQVTWTAEASGGTAGPLQYEFWVRNEEVGNWQLAQAFSVNRFFSWDTWSTEPGPHRLYVFVKSANANSAYEGYLLTSSFLVR